MKNKKINQYVNKLEILLKKKHLWSLPRYVQAEPTNLCNQQCKMCPRNANLDAPLGSMSFDNFKKLYQQIPTIENLQLNGLGEPLLNEEIFKMISYAKEKGSVVVLTSNCELATKEKAGKMVESGLDILKISMDSTDEKIYTSIRHGNLKNALTGIKNIVEAKKMAGREKPLIWFNSILMRNNYERMIDIIKLGDELKIDLVRFKPIGTFDIYKDKDLVAPPDKLFNEIKLAVKQSKKYSVRHNLESLLANKDIYYRPKDITYPCYSPWLEVYIQWYGGVRLCCEFYSKKYDIGNMFEKDFKEIWNSGQMGQIRGLFSKGQMNFPVCQTCNRFQRNIVIYKKIENFKNKFYLK